MPVYEYVALDERGKNVKGTVDAESTRGARQKLRGRNIYPTELRESFEAAKPSSRDVLKFLRSGRASSKALAIATRQLATLIGAGLPVVQALAALADQTDSAALNRIVVDVKERVQQGSALAEAFAAYPGSFPRLYINMVAAGEASGTLDTVLLNLASYLEEQVELKRRIQSALLYPVVMLVICILVITALFVFVVPSIVEIFVKQGAVLPLPTRIMIFVSDLLIGYWFVIILLPVAGSYALRRYYATEPGRAMVDRILLRLPVYSSIYIKICTARIASTLGALLQSGVQLLTGLDITRNIVGNVHIAQALEQAREGVREGRSLAGELSKSNIFPSMLHHMIAVGEKTGELENMLGKAGSAYQNEVNSTLDGLTSLLEPLLLVIVGGVVLCIVISVLLPMAELIDVIQR